MEADELAEHLQEWAESGLVNILGGCCGSTPAHIKQVAKAVDGLQARTLPEIDVKMRLSGLEPFVH
jgi:23S rRNA pseudoU1915 N3-methylase RlmH